MKRVRFWGKEQDKGGVCHLVQLHCLDVAAVADALIEADAVLRSRVERLAGMPWEEVRLLLLFFIAIHDLGKFSCSFQMKQPELAQVLGQEVASAAGTHHTITGQFFYEENVLDDEPAPLISWDYELALQPLVFAVFGHHGLPVKGAAYSDEFAKSKDAALAHVRDVARLFGLDGVTLPDMDEEYFKPLSWLLAGIMVVADWIGSSQRYFPYRDELPDYEEYYAETLERARAAIRDCGLLHPPPAVMGEFDALLPDLAGKTPTPLQRYALEQAVTDNGPQLHIFEDLTGSGKTEAACLCAHRVMSLGGCGGLYVGLPTMATANAMYARLAKTYRAMFDPASHPSLMLAHGKSKMEDEFMSTIPLEDEAAPDQVGEKGDATCAQWLADNRKKALLAPCGAGTLDQALLGVLAAKHQCLRLLGLSRVVLVADEIHSYDIYTSSLVESLLTFVAGMGGSAVLLTATLPNALRAKLVNAFRRGLGHDEIQELDEGAFPLATKVDERGVVTATPIEAWRELSVDVQLVHDEERMYEAAAEAHRAGACACWIRNTVDQAAEAHARLVDEYGLPPEKVILIHARFAMCDRLVLEREIRRRFGKEGEASGRAGYVIVGTQLLEQSLDYDVDVMLSDLAPMDALIQRAGRCQRHAAIRNDLVRPKGFERARMIMLSPPPMAEPSADWYEAILGNARWVYPRQCLLWRTATLLARKGRIELPVDARELMEGAYGAVSCPAVLEEADLFAEGGEQAKGGLAKLNSLHFDQGYCEESGQGGWTKEVKAATRVGPESVSLRLCKVEDGRATLWAEGTDAKACARSEVSVSVSKVGGEHWDPALDQVMQRLRESMPDKGKWTILIPLARHEDEWRGTAEKKGQPVEIRYSRLRGLAISPR